MDRETETEDRHTQTCTHRYMSEFRNDDLIFIYLLSVRSKRKNKFLDNVLMKNHFYYKTTMIFKSQKSNA